MEAFPDESDGYYCFIDPYTMEADPYITSEEWRTVRADSVEEAGEKIFRQYMEMYTGENVPDYYRIDDYCIIGVTDLGKDIENYGVSLYNKVGKWSTYGIFSKASFARIEYSFMPANKCGNTVHNKNWGFDSFLNGIYNNCEMGLELEKHGNEYTVVNIGSIGIWGSAVYHFENKLTGSSGVIAQADAIAKAGLLDYSWNDSDKLPDPQDICEYSYRRNYGIQLSLPAPTPEAAEIFPDSLSFVRDTNIDRSYIETADCKYIADDGCFYLDTSKLYYDESSYFEYCGYEHDLEKGSSVIYGNVLGDKPHGVKLIIYTDSDKLIDRRLHAVDVTEELYAPYVFHDSFSGIDFPESINSAEEILEYMKAPRNGCDFTVMDYRNISEEADGTYAEVRFKGRLDGQYSVDLTKDSGDGYLRTKVT